MWFKPDQILAIKPVQTNDPERISKFSLYSPLFEEVELTFSTTHLEPKIKEALSNPNNLVLGQDLKELCSLLYRSPLVPRSRLLDLDLLQSLDPLTPDPYPKVPTPRDIYFNTPWYLSRLDGKRGLLYKHLVEGIFPLISSLENTPLIDSEGREVYSIYNLGTANSGRIYSSGRRGFSPQVVRKTQRERFRPPPGYKFIIADQRNMEFRILAHLSRDPSLISFFAEDIDIHEAVGKFLASRGANRSILPDDRRLAKAVNFLLIFGGTPYGLAQKTGMTLAQAEKFIRVFFSAFPHIEEWSLKTKISALEQGYIESDFGRIRKFDREADLESELRSVQNFCVQSFAADVNTLIFRGIHHLLPDGAKVMILVHDGIVVGSRPNLIPDCLDILRTCFENPPGLSLFGIKLEVPLRVKLSVSDSWF